MFYSIPEICQILGGGTPKTSVPEYWNGDICWLSVKDFAGDDRYVYDTEKKITELGLNNSSTKLLEKDDIIISARGTVGEMAMIPYPMAFNQSCFGIRGNEKVDKTYLYYLLKTKIRELKKQANGAVFDTITISTFNNITCDIPPLDIQKNIAAQLSEIDDKIAINKKICDNLEAQAQALFKHWFVDFAPFKDGKFVESELGLIPEGWRVFELQELVTIKRGGSPRPIQNYLSERGYRWLKISDATCTASPFVFEIKEKIKESGLSKTVHLKEGSLVLSNSATPGIPKIMGVDTCIHDGWLYFPQSQLSKYFLFLLFKDRQKFLLSQGNGSVFTNLKTDIVKALKVVLPPMNTMENFGIIAESLFNTIEIYTLESLRLAALRDTLLPKLMSGQIKV